MALSNPSLTAPSDKDLVTLAKSGDADAFTQLIDRNAPKVYRTARHITKNDADAEDVLQEAFLKAYSKLGQFEGTAQFYTWLTRIVVNEALMRLRGQKRRRTVSLDEELQTEDSSIVRETRSQGETPAEAFERSEVADVVAHAIDSLDEKYRAVFVLRGVEGFSTEETAQMLELSTSAVKSRLLRARLKLKDQLKGVLGNHVGSA